VERLIDHDGELYLDKNFLLGGEAENLHNQLLNELDWNEEFITIAGKPIKVPRLVCWHGDTGVQYRYSGTDHIAQCWTSSLLKLKEKLLAVTGKTFNGVLGNQYKNGQDSMGWHADKEKVLGAAPYIALLSLGDERLFKVRHNKSKKVLDLNLTNGSLLVMAGSLQKNWQHSLPKTSRIKANRISLSFRTIIC